MVLGMESASIRLMQQIRTQLTWNLPKSPPELAALWAQVRKQPMTAQPIKPGLIMLASPPNHLHDRRLIREPSANG
jgi:hypothetical protein